MVTRVEGSGHSPAHLRTVIGCVLISLSVTVADYAVAGGGPENVFLVVNGRSWASRTIANHYADLRFIPATNVFFLDWDGSVERTTIATFREKILLPILTTIEKRGLKDQIDYIVYSSDFPYEIDFSSELTRPGRFMSASITGLTFLYEMVLDRQSGMLGGRTNWYANTGTGRTTTLGFRHQQAWKAFGKRSTDSKGRRYYLSAMLGYSSGRGNSVEDIVQYLRRSALADGMHPQGTVYFMKNGDVRTTTRSPHFKSVVTALQSEGGRAEILDGTTPTRKDDVVGAMLGRAKFNWERSQSRFLPGAICENLTSFGGVLKQGAGQTPLTEVLRYGAAGSSGTVIEPYSILAKFPHPVIHLHYRRGCSLAEAFYLSVPSPYQLLIVGDPLCRPFATPPRVTVMGVRPGEEISGEVEVTPTAEVLPGQAVEHFKLHVDGRERQTCALGSQFVLNSERMPDGHHELRVVAVVNDKLQTQGRMIIPVRVANRDRTITARLTTPERQSWDRQIAIDVEAPDATRLMVFNKHKMVAEGGVGPRQTIAFSPRNLGLGPVSLLVAGLGETTRDNVLARPVRLEITPGPLLRSRPSAVGLAGQDGLELTRQDGTRKSVPSTAPAKWLKQAGVKAGETFTLTATFSVPRTSVHQFQIRQRGALTLQVDGLPIARLDNRNGFIRHEFPVYLQRGTHQLRVQATAGRNPRMELGFGEFGTQALSGPTFKHSP